MIDKRMMYSQGQRVAKTLDGSRPAAVKLAVPIRPVRASASSAGMADGQWLLLHCQRNASLRVLSGLCRVHHTGEKPSEQRHG
mgnify:CR=1 FL=1